MANNPWWLTTDFNFIRVPKELFRNPYYGALSTESKLLYGFLLDRVSLSWTNGENWRTEDGDPFVIFTLAEIGERLHCSKPKAIALLNALEAHHLIRRDRPQKDGPYHIVVRSFHRQVTKSDLPRSENLTCPGQKCLPAQVKKFDLNNTDINNTEKNKTDRITQLEREITERIQYDFLIRDGYPGKQVDTILEVMIQVLTSTAKTITVSGIPMEAELVKAYLRRAEVMRIQYLFDHMDTLTEPIHSYRAYCLARLCDPESAVDQFYETLQADNSL